MKAFETENHISIYRMFTIKNIIENIKFSYSIIFKSCMISHVFYVPLCCNE